MTSPNPKKLADAILRARGTPKYDELVAQTFAPLLKTKDGLEIAWKILELADERGCTTSVRSSGKGYDEREVRVLGRIVAWRDSKSTRTRDYAPPGKVNFHVEATREAATKLADGVVSTNVFTTFGQAEDFPIAPEEGNGPMVNAVRSGDLPILKLLLARGGDPYGKTDKGHRVIDFAKKLGNKKVIALLASQGEAPPIDMTTAIATDNIERVLELVAKEGADDVVKLCGQGGHTEVLRAVLASKKKPKPEALARALYSATFNGHEESFV